jgi:hypothetical protein
MHSYLVTLVDRLTGEYQKVIVQSDCVHGMQEYIDAQVVEGRSEIRLVNPVVIDIDDRVARHIPLRHPTT